MNDTTAISCDSKVTITPGVVDEFEQSKMEAKNIPWNWHLEIQRSDRKRNKYISGYGHIREDLMNSWI